MADIGPVSLPSEVEAVLLKSIGLDYINLYSILAVLIISFIYWNYVKFTYWSSRGVKGPMPVPFLGTDFYFLFKNRIEIEMRWRKQYGKTYGIYSQYKPALVTTDNELIKHVLIKDFDHFTNRRSFIVTPELKRTLFFSKDADWSRKRAILTPAFTSRRIRRMFELMRSCTEKLLHELDNMTQNGKKSAVISKDIFMCLALDVIAKACFATDLNTYRDRNSEFSRKAFAFAQFDVSRLICVLVLPKFVREWIGLDLVAPDKLNFFDAISQRLLAERRAANQFNKNHPEKPRTIPDDVLQLLFEAEKTAEIDLERDDAKDAHYTGLSNDDIRDEHKRQFQETAKLDKKLTDFEICSQMILFFIAGFETTSNALSLCLYELANNQNSQELVYQELNANLDKLKLNSTQHSDLFELKYLDAFISEVLRLYAPVTSVDRELGQDYKIPNTNITLEKDSFVSIPYYVLHHDSEYWPNPEKFDINRFLPENRDKIKPCTYAPFGLGPRHCVGMRFALAEIKLALSQLILKYKVTRSDDSGAYPPKFTRHFFFLQLKNSKVCISERDTKNN